MKPLVIEICILKLLFLCSGKHVFTSKTRNITVLINKRYVKLQRAIYISPEQSISNKNFFSFLALHILHHLASLSKLFLPITSGILCLLNIYH